MEDNPESAAPSCYHWHQISGAASVLADHRMSTGWITRSIIISSHRIGLWFFYKRKSWICMYLPEPNRLFCAQYNFEETLISLKKTLLYNFNNFLTLLHNMKMYIILSGCEIAIEHIGSSYIPTGPSMLHFLLHHSHISCLVYSLTQLLYVIGWYTVHPTVLCLSGIG